MIEWSEAPLEKLLVAAGSGTWGKEPDGSMPVYPVLRSTNIRDGKLVLDEPALRAVSETIAAKYLLAKGDILVTTSSGSAQLLGKNGIVGDLPGYDGEYLFSNFTWRLRPDPQCVVPRFLYYYLNSPLARAELQRIQSTTSGLRNLNTNLYLAQPIPLPPLSEQRRIVEILDQSDRLRRLRGESDAKAERILPALFIEMFGDPATNPMGWPVDHLSELGRPLSGGAFPLNEQGLTEGEIPFIKVSDMNTQGNEWFIRRANNYVSRATLRTLKVKSAPAGTIVFPKIGAAIATNKKRLLVRETAYDNNVIGVVPKDDTFAAYLFGFFQLFDLRSLARSTALPSIKASELARLPVPRPHPEVARAFGDRFLVMAQIRDVTTKAGLVIDTLFQNLMHRAFSGSLTASWRKALLKKALEEMEEQAKA